MEGDEDCSGCDVVFIISEGQIVEVAGLIESGKMIWYQGGELGKGSGVLSQRWLSNIVWNLGVRILEPKGGRSWKDEWRC